MSNIIKIPKSDRIMGEIVSIVIAKTFLGVIVMIVLWVLRLI